MRSNVRKMFDGLYMKTETTYRAGTNKERRKTYSKKYGESFR